MADEEEDEEDETDEAYQARLNIAKEKFNSDRKIAHDKQ